MKMFFVFLIALFLVYAGFLLWDMSRLRQIYTDFRDVKTGTSYLDLPYESVRKPKKITCYSSERQQSFKFSSLNDFKESFPVKAGGCESISFTYDGMFSTKRALVKVRFDKQLKTINVE